MDTEEELLEGEEFYATIQETLQKFYDRKEQEKSTGKV